MRLKRLFDVLAAFFGLILLSPLFLLLALLIKLDSKGPVFYLQQRVGRNNKDFRLYKFRSMAINADRKGLLTVGARDTRVTRVGYFIRKYKLDEIPQLFNVLNGTMSLVGPRPEVRKYVDLYTSEQLKILTVRPGITDWASIKYINENEVLGKASDPELAYVNIVMPEKLALSLDYINNYSLSKDFQIILLTLSKIIGVRKI